MNERITLHEWVRGPDPHTPSEAETVLRSLAPNGESLRPAGQWAEASSAIREVATEPGVGERRRYACTDRSAFVVWPRTPGSEAAPGVHEDRLDQVRRRAPPGARDARWLTAGEAQAMYVPIHAPTG